MVKRSKSKDRVSPPSSSGGAADLLYDVAFGRSRYVKPLPTYVVDLRLPPSQRWLSLPQVVDTAYTIASARGYVDEIASSVGLPRIASTTNPLLVSLRWLLFLFLRPTGIMGDSDNKPRTRGSEAA